MNIINIKDIIFAYMRILNLLILYYNLEVISVNEFFDNLSKAAKDAAKRAMKVSGDAVELTKASVNIKLDEAKRDNLYKEIGKSVHELHKKNIETVVGADAAPVVDLCKCIDEIETAINDQKAKTASISNKKFCINCGEKVDKNYIFCYACGAKQPEIIEEEEECCCCCESENNSDSCCDDSSCDCNDSSCGCDDSACDCDDATCECDDSACDCDNSSDSCNQET